MHLPKYVIIDKYDFIMIYISNPTDSCVKIQEGDFWMVIPRGVLFTISDESDRITLKTKGSRKSVYAFNYANCNVAGNDAASTVENLANYL